MESEFIAWGASGRNGGFVSPGYALSYNDIERRVGVSVANNLYAMSIEGMQAVSNNIRALGIDAALPVQRIMSAYHYPAASMLAARKRWLEELFDYDVDYLNRQALSAHLTSDSYHDALHDKNTFHLNPLAYARALANEIRAAGSEISENNPVIGISRKQNGWQIKTNTHSIHSRELEICTGGYTGSLTPLTTDSAIFDDRRASDYYRLVDNGRRILWGGRITTRTSEPRSLASLLHKSMLATYPQLQGMQVDTAWSGLMSYARHQMPQIGRLADGMWYCTAFGGHGMNTTAIGGRVVAEAITGESDRYRCFEPFGLQFTGGVLGRLAVQAAYWRYQWLDRMRE